MNLSVVGMWGEAEVCLCVCVQYSSGLEPLWSDALSLGETQRDSTEGIAKSHESCGSGHADCIQRFTIAVWHQSISTTTFSIGI